MMAMLVWGTGEVCYVGDTRGSGIVSIALSPSLCHQCFSSIILGIQFMP